MAEGDTNQPGPKEPAKDAPAQDAGTAPATVTPPANDNPPKPAALVFNAKAMVAESGEASAFPRPPRAFPARKVLIESRESSVFPRPDVQDSRFQKILRFLGMGDFVDATRQPKNKGHLLGQAIFTKIGFGDIYRAARQPHGKVRGTLKALGTKMADMAAGRIVSGSFKLIAITFVAGMIGGVSGWGSIFLLGLATGASSAIYSYGKNYISDKLSLPKYQRSKVKIFDKNRALEAAKAFGSGAVNGAFGLWLANLPIFQHVMKYLHGLIHDGIGQISKPFSIDDTSAKPAFWAKDRKLSGDFAFAAKQTVASAAPAAPLLRRAPALG